MASFGPAKRSHFWPPKIGSWAHFWAFFWRILGHENRPVLGRQSGQFRVQILDPFWELQVLVLCSSLSASMDQFWALNWVHLWGSGSFVWATKLEFCCPFGLQDSDSGASSGPRLQSATRRPWAAEHMFLIFWTAASPEASDEGRCIPTMGKLQQGCG